MLPVHMKSTFSRRCSHHVPPCPVHLVDITPPRTAEQAHHLVDITSPRTAEQASFLTRSRTTTGASVFFDGGDFNSSLDWPYRRINLSIWGDSCRLLAVCPDGSTTAGIRRDSRGLLAGCPDGISTALGVDGYRGEKHNDHSCDKQGISRFHFVLLLWFMRHLYGLLLHECLYIITLASHRLNQNLSGTPDWRSIYGRERGEVKRRSDRQLSIRCGSGLILFVRKCVRKRWPRGRSACNLQAHENKNQGA